MIALKWLMVGVVLGGAALFAFTVEIRKKRMRRYQRSSMEIESLLPDSKNEYLRHRLQTALAPAETCSPPDAEFLHARKLLYSLGEKKLTAADSLLLRKLQKDVGVYATKEYFSQSDKGEIATTLSRVLTLCAKYEV